VIASECIRDALLRIGVLPEGGEPSAVEVRDGITILNDMLNTWTLDGPHRWRRANVTVALVAGTATYALAADVARVMTVRYVDVLGYERPMTEWMPDDFDRMPIKTQQGLPTVYVVDRLNAATTLTLWPVPFEAASMIVSYERFPIECAVGTDAVDVPREWREATKLTLAARLADEYQLQNEVINRVRERAMMAYEQVNGFDRETRVSFRLQRRV
jgi:hypothetical protein